MKITSLVKKVLHLEHDKAQNEIFQKVEQHGIQGLSTDELLILKQSKSPCAKEVTRRYSDEIAQVSSDRLEELLKITLEKCTSTPSQAELVVKSSPIMNAGKQSCNNAFESEQTLARTPIASKCA